MTVAKMCPLCGQESSSATVCLKCHNAAHSVEAEEVARLRAVIQKADRMREHAGLLYCSDPFDEGRAALIDYDAARAALSGGGK